MASADLTQRQIILFIYISGNNDLGLRYNVLGLFLKAALGP